MRAASLRMVAIVVGVILTLEGVHQGRVEDVVPHALGHHQELVSGARRHLRPQALV